MDKRKGLAGLVDSKRFWVVLGTLVTLLLTARFPEYADKINVIVPVLVALALALVGSYTLEDTAAAWGTRPTNLSDTLRALLEEFIGAGGLSVSTPPDVAKTKVAPLADGLKKANEALDKAQALRSSVAIDVKAEG